MSRLVLLLTPVGCAVLVLPKQAPFHDLSVCFSKKRDAVLCHLIVQMLIDLQRVLIDRHDGFVVVIRRDTIEGELAAILTAMNDHQLALIEARVLFALPLQRQADRFHARLAGREPIARRVQIEVTRGQAVRAVITIVHTRQHGLRRDKVVAVYAHKIAKGVARAA